jgi:hypothetical protein
MASEGSQRRLAGADGVRARAAWQFGLLVLGLAGPAVAAPNGWVLNTNQTVHPVNLATNAEGAPMGLPFASNSLAMSPAGTRYSADAFGNLWDVTLGFIPVGPTMRTQIGDLTWGAGGLWGYSNATQELFFFDLGSASVTWAVTLALPGSLSPTAVITGVAHQAATGDVFLSAADGLNNDWLLRVPAASATALLVGAMPQGDSFSYISDIEFDATGTLYAMTWFHRWFYSVDPATGATTLVSTGPHRDSTALALMPVPEPATSALLGLGLGLVAWRLRTNKQAAAG